MRTGSVNPRYRRYVSLNRNVLIAFAISIIVSATVAQIFEEEQDHINATYTLAADYAVFFAVFGTLYCIDNRAKYYDENGDLDRAALKKDLVKIVSSLGVAELVYTAARWLLQYQLLAAGHDPYAASIISHGISTVIYLVVLNLGVKVTGLHKDGS